MCFVPPLPSCNDDMLCCKRLITRCCTFLLKRTRLLIVSRVTPRPQPPLLSRTLHVSSRPSIATSTCVYSTTAAAFSRRTHRPCAEFHDRSSPTLCSCTPQVHRRRRSSITEFGYACVGRRNALSTRTTPIYRQRRIGSTTFSLTPFTPATSLQAARQPSGGGAASSRGSNVDGGWRSAPTVNVSQVCFHCDF